MLSGKHIGYIALLAIAGVLIYYFFFRKKAAATTISSKKTSSQPGSQSSGSVQPNLSSRQSSQPSQQQPTGTVDNNMMSASPNSFLPPPVARPSGGERSYVGPQDCAENCDLPYENYVLFCYDKQDGSQACLDKAEALKRECLMKCSQSLPQEKDLSEIITTPLHEDNYFSNLFRQGYV